MTLARRFVAAPLLRLGGDKAYDADALDRRLAAQGLVLIAPHRANRTKTRTQDGRVLRRLKRRFVIERFFAWLHSYRRLLTRYEVRLENYVGFVHLACTRILLRAYL